MSLRGVWVIYYREFVNPPSLQSLWACCDWWSRGLSWGLQPRSSSLLLLPLLTQFVQTAGSRGSRGKAFPYHFRWMFCCQCSKPVSLDAWLRGSWWCRGHHLAFWLLECWRKSYPFWLPFQFCLPRHAWSVKCRCDQQWPQCCGVARRGNWSWISFKERPFKAAAGHAPPMNILLCICLVCILKV